MTRVANEERYRSIVESQSELICRYTPDFRLTYVNEAYARYTGRSPRDLVGVDLRDFVPEGTRDSVTSAIRSLTPEHASRITEHPALQRDGSIGWQEWVDTAFFDAAGEPVEYQAVGRDITERRSLEETLREREERLELALTGTELGVWDWYIQEDRVHYDDRWGRMLGYEPEELEPVYETFKQLVHPDDYERAARHLMDHIEGRNPRYEEEIRMRTRDGSWKWILTKGQVMERDSLGQAVRAAGTHRDITAWKEAQEARRRSEEHLRAMMEHIPDGLAVVDEEGRLAYVNSGFYRFLGYTEGEVFGRHTRDFVVPEELEQLHARMRDIFAGKDVPAARYHLMRKDGTTVPIESRARRFTLDGKPTLLAIFRDLRPQDEAERLAAEYQDRLRAMTSQAALAEERERRRIAAGLHDRTVQTLGLLRIQLGRLESELPERDAARASIPELRRLLDDALADTRSLMFELSSPVLYELGFSPAIEWLTETFSNQLGIPIDFHDAGTPALPQELGVFLFQAVRELLVNVGKHAQASSARVGLSSEGECLTIVVSDDGRGFDPERNQPDPAGGTGFGLFHIRERVDLLGGSLEICATPGGGTRVILAVCMKE